MSTDSFEPLDIKESQFMGDEEALNPEQDLLDAENVLKNHPYDVYGMLNKGVALGRLKRYKEADETLTKAKEYLLELSSPESQGQAAMMAYNLACFLDQTGNKGGRIHDPRCLLSISMLAILLMAPHQVLNQQKGTISA